MPSPYAAHEIASALVDAAGRAGLQLRIVTIAPDEEAQVWLIRIAGEDGSEQTLTFPFASAHGIYTPAEIARQVTRGSWPFA